MVAALQLGEHLLVRLGPFLLRPDEEEPENDEHEDERQELHEHIRAFGSRAPGLGRAHGESDGFEQNAPPEV